MKFRLSEGKGECFYYVGACHGRAAADSASTGAHCTLRTSSAATTAGKPAVLLSTCAKCLFCRKLVVVSQLAMTPVLMYTPTHSGCAPYDLCTNMLLHHCAPGVEDDGYPRGLDPPELAASMATVSAMAQSLGAHATLLHHVPGGFGRRGALLHVTFSARDELSYTDLRIAGGMEDPVLGSVHLTVHYYCRAGLKQTLMHQAGPDNLVSKLKNQLVLDGAMTCIFVFWACSGWQHGCWQVHAGGSADTWHRWRPVAGQRPWLCPHERV